MKFVREQQPEAARAIALALGQALSEGKHVLWLVSGGSNIAIEVAIMATLQETLDGSLDHLTILLTDERYGKPGHVDSNYGQLRAAGFDADTARFPDVLSLDLPLEQTVEYYTTIALDAFGKADVVVAQFGVGSDGHIAGILPHSPAANKDVAEVVGYKWTDHTRMTLTAPLLTKINSAYVLAYGAGKKEALERLRKNQETFASLPSNLLYQIADAYVYNDQVE